MRFWEAINLGAIPIVQAAWTRPRRRLGRGGARHRLLFGPTCMARGCSGHPGGAPGHCRRRLQATVSSHAHRHQFARSPICALCSAGGASGRFLCSAAMCHRQRVERHHRAKACRARPPVKNALCRGLCGRQAARPLLACCLRSAAGRVYALQRRPLGRCAWRERRGRCRMSPPRRPRCVLGAANT